VHAGVGVYAVASQALALKPPGSFDPGANGLGGLAVPRVSEVAVGDPGDLDVQVDAVEKRAAEVARGAKMRAPFPSFQSRIAHKIEISLKIPASPELSWFGYFHQYWGGQHPGKE
jgi:hypothetical protein